MPSSAQADMVLRRLDVTVNRAKNLKNVRHVRKMKVYVVVSLCGNPRNENQQDTPVCRGGGTNPQWDHPFSFDVDEAAARAGHLTLEFVIMDRRKIRGDLEVGRVGVPVTVLLEPGTGDGTPQVMSKNVRLQSGGTQGDLEFSYKFHEQFTVATPPEANNKSDIADPAAKGPPNSAPGNQRPTGAGLMTVQRVTNTVANATEMAANATQMAVNVSELREDDPSPEDGNDDELEEDDI